MTLVYTDNADDSTVVHSMPVLLTYIYFAIPYMLTGSCGISKEYNQQGPSRQSPVKYLGFTLLHLEL